MSNPTRRRGADLVLPYPPSVNRYYTLGQTFGGRRNVRISAEGKAYRQLVALELRKQLGRISPFVDELAVYVWQFPPDRRKRDRDNIAKALLDALEGRLYVDDYQIGLLQIERRAPCVGGQVSIWFEPWACADLAEPQSMPKGRGVNNAVV